MSTGNMSVGERAIDFTLPEAASGNVTLSDLLKKQNVVLLFYRGLF